ncbi:ubiquinol-cytochrome c reductase iron-sulfur subunit [Methylophaga sp. 42_25_T18]|nr:ubiquinol-cytochrome c reductase iron-sulfur subunit [Methylophaga sp. 42_25_T18]OUR86074.1 ubiquinol-cytochrome c reductase iron-sulfur subunit [Methylophaga sp. 42_8_T64]
MSNTVDNDKRRFLTTAASVVVGGAGAAVAAVPFVSSMLPSAKAQAAGAPVNVDISKLELGQLMTIEWRGKPVWIYRRTAETVTNLSSQNDSLKDPESTVSKQQPDYCVNESRSIKEELMVLVGVCTHLGCSPTYRPELAPVDLGPEWKGGFFCPCHGSRFDLAGRVFQGVPAPINLQVPPYYFLGDNRIVIGEDTQGVA